MNEQMKSSGIDWIGDIPSEWDITKVRYVTKLRSEQGFYNSDDKYIGLENISSYTGKYISTESEYDAGTYDIYKAGDLLFSKLRPYLAKALIADDCGFCTGELAVIKEYNGDIRYLFYYMLSDGFLKMVDASTYGSKMPRASWDYIKNLQIPVMEKREQQAIADFLDKECAQIDSVAADLEKQIELLQQYKKSLITETVTKGLKENAPMRVSKVEYVSSIPAHWKEKRLSVVAYVRARLGWKGLTADEYVDEGYAFLSAFNIIDDKLELSEDLLNHITKFRYDESPEIKLRNGDVLLVKDGAGLGKCARIDNLPFETAPNGSLAVITPNQQLHYRYLYYFLVGDTFQQRINQIKNGMGVPHLPQGDLRKIVVPIPPMNEQVIISDYLDKRCGLVGLLLDEKKKQLEKIRQHKKSLIYEYVTGKKRVKEVQ